MEEERRELEERLANPPNLYSKDGESCLLFLILLVPVMKCLFTLYSIPVCRG